MIGGVLGGVVGIFGVGLVAVVVCGVVCWASAADVDIVG